MGNYYTVTTGEYDDYVVIGLFESEQKIPDVKVVSNYVNDWKNVETYLNETGKNWRKVNYRIEYEWTTTDGTFKMWRTFNRNTEHEYQVWCFEKFGLKLVPTEEIYI